MIEFQPATQNLSAKFTPVLVGVVAVMMGGYSPLEESTNPFRSAFVSIDNSENYDLKSQEYLISTGTDASSPVDIEKSTDGVAVSDASEIIQLLLQVYDLGERQDGWKGEASLAATKQTTDEAFKLVLSMHRDLLDFYPRIGLDEDGTFLFFWHRGSVIANLSVYGDGTYSYFARNGKLSAANDAAKIAGRLHEDLVNILVS